MLLYYLHPSVCFGFDITRTCVEIDVQTSGQALTHALLCADGPVQLCREDRYRVLSPNHYLPRPLYPPSQNMNIVDFNVFPCCFNGFVYSSEGLFPVMHLFTAEEVGVPHDFPPLVRMAMCLAGRLVTARGFRESPHISARNRFIYHSAPVKVFSHLYTLCQHPPPRPNRAFSLSFASHSIKGFAL